MKKFKVGNTTYQRATKYGVGKLIGGKLYVHKNYAEEIDNVSFNKAKKFLPADFKYNCVMFDFKANRIRFDEAPDFDSAREPIPGDFIEVNLNTGDTKKGHSNFIWHHKWMWVRDDYKGFDVDESYEWSQTWVQYQKWKQFNVHPSGVLKIWMEQIKEIEQGR